MNVPAPPPLSLETLSELHAPRPAAGRPARGVVAYRALAVAIILGTTAGLAFLPSGAPFHRRRRLSFR